MSNFNIGEVNTLIAARQEPQGFYLRGEDPFDQVLLPNAYIPESFKVLIKEMQSLCLDVEVLDQAGQQVEIRELDEDVYRATEELGIDLSRPERGSDDEDERRNVGVIR